MAQTSPLCERSFDVPTGHEHEIKFTEDDLTAARQAGFADGRAAGAEEAKATAEGHLVQLIHNLSEGVTSLVARDDERTRTVMAECAEVLYEICKKAMPSLAEHAALDEIIGVVRDCLTTQTEEPRIVVRVADGISEAVQAQLTKASAGTGFVGQLVLIPDNTLETTDCTVLWADGGAERSFQEIWSKIEQALTRVIEGTHAEYATPPQPASP